MQSILVYFSSMQALQSLELEMQQSLHGLGRSPGGGNSYPLQYSGLENYMDCVVHGVTKSQTRLSDFPSLTDPLELHISSQIQFENK